MEGHACAICERAYAFRHTARVVRGYASHTPRYCLRPGISYPQS